MAQVRVFTPDWQYMEDYIKSLPYSSNLQEVKMSEVEDASEAEDIVRSLWSVGDPEMYNFEVHKQGYAWIVTYETQTIRGVTGHIARINAHTGNILRHGTL